MIDCCYVNTTWYPRKYNNIGAVQFYDDEDKKTLTEFKILFKTSDDFNNNQVFIEDVSIFLFSTTTNVLMNANLYLKVMSGSTETWQLISTNSPGTYGDVDNNVFKLKLFEEYDDLITLIPNRDYKIEISFIGPQTDIDNIRYMTIQDDTSINDGQCDGRLDCDLEGYFEHIATYQIFGFEEELLSNNKYIGMYMNFGCLFEPRDASKPITTPIDPMPKCEAIADPGNVCIYNK